MDTEVDVPNDNLLLIPGMYAEVNLTLDRRNGVIAVPLTAVDMDENAAAGHVLLVTPNNTVETRKVTLGLETANLVEVRSGLNDGDLVVIGGRSALQAGQEVRPKVTVMSAGKS